MWFRRGAKARIIFLLAIMTSCSSISSVTEAQAESEATLLQIRTIKSTNQGTPFYVVLKYTDFTNFLSDEYQQIASLEGSEEEGKEFKSFCIIPGMTKSIKIKPLKDKSAAVYFLFTQPNEDWKYLIEPGEEVKNISISLGVHEINHIKTW